MSRFYLTNTEKRYLWLLFFLLIIVLAVRLTWENARPSDAANDFQAKTELGKRSSSISFATGNRVVESFVFEPNTADSTALLRLGLTPAQVRSIYRFRSQGYRYHETEDFMSVPHLTVEQWEHLRPLIQIDPKYREVNKPNRNHWRNGQDFGHRDSVMSTESEGKRARKVMPGTLIDINTADSATLCMVPKIGEYWSGRIIRRRRELGGFVRPDQMMELDENFPEEALAYLTVSNEAIANMEKIDINKCSFQRMVNHPYLSYKQVLAIKAFNKKYGALRSMQELMHLDAFSAEDTIRLEQYIHF